MSIFKWNRRIIQVMNSCKYEEFEKLINELLELPNYKKFFTSKWYIWNVMRPRDFYKMCAMYIQKITDGQTDHFDKAEKLIKIVLHSAKSEQIKKTFVWNITKNTPIIMWDMVPYMSKEKIIVMMVKKKYVIADEIIQPFFEAANLISQNEKE